MGTKNKPAASDCYALAEGDEPLFVLLARDLHAPFLVQAWADIREKAGESKEKVAEARACADAMRGWAQTKRGKPPMGIPAVYELLSHGTIAAVLLKDEDDAEEAAAADPAADPAAPVTVPSTSPPSVAPPPPSPPAPPAVPVHKVSFAHDVTLGIPSDFDLRYCCEFVFQPHRMTTSAPGLGFAFLSKLMFGTTMGLYRKDALTFAQSDHDLYGFCTVGLGQALEAPYLTPNERIQCQGHYDGGIPAGRYPGEPFTLTMVLEGPLMTEEELRKAMADR